MRDSRLDRLAEVMVNYSAGVKKGDLVRIGGESGGLPLMNAIFEHVVRVGGNPFLHVVTDEADDALLRLGSDAQLSYVNPVTQYMVDHIDVYFGIRGSENTKSRSNVPPEKQALASQARKPILKSLMSRAAKKEMRWSGTQYPTAAAAQDAEMSLFEYENFIFDGCLLNLPDPVAGWKAMAEKQQRLVDYLDNKKEIRVIAPGTDLRVGVEGRTWINCSGHVNFPDGEVFTGPIETATEGTIRYSFPAVHLGRECHDIVLTFKGGKVIDARAGKGEDFLIKTIDQDAGARILGEFAIGTNFGIKRYTKNVLFDEKIGGTCHAALGAAYPDSGGKNESGLHWDMVCDLRMPGCKILADGEVIMEAGRFVRGEWPNP
jgi:aminopeptidase